MENGWGYYTPPRYAVNSGFDEMSPGEQQNHLFPVPMDRSKMSGSSTGSNCSTISHADQNYGLSPISPHSSSSISEESLPCHMYMYDQFLDNSLSSEQVMLLREITKNAQQCPTPFDIEKHGDPRINPRFYYEFVVKKNEAYFLLQPFYIPSKKFPLKIPYEIEIVSGKKNHRCLVFGCDSHPFTRHYDLERHFRTIHGGDEDTMNCDYSNCSHEKPFRKDHCREHYRDYHNEDLIKRCKPKPSSPKHNKENHKRGQKKEETVHEFLTNRRNIKLSWWRCSKCVQRVKVNTYGYTCPTCRLPCEIERVAHREKLEEEKKLQKALYSTSSLEAGISTSGSSSIPLGSVYCIKCQTLWLPDENDMIDEISDLCSACQLS